MQIRHPLQICSAVTSRRPNFFPGLKGWIYYYFSSPTFSKSKKRSQRFCERNFSWHNVWPCLFVQQSTHATVVTCSLLKPPCRPFVEWILPWEINRLWIRKGRNIWQFIYMAPLITRHHMAPLFLFLLIPPPPLDFLFPRWREQRIGNTSDWNTKGGWKKHQEWRGKFWTQWCSYPTLFLKSHKHNDRLWIVTADLELLWGVWTSIRNDEGHF